MVRPGRRSKRKKTGQYNKKVTKILNFPVFGATPINQLDPRAAWWVMSMTMTCAKFQIELFMGYELRPYDVTGGRIFDFPIDFLHGP